MIQLFGSFVEDAPPPASGRCSSGLHGSVILDRAWAERLGVRRVCGVYRISRRELARRLAQLGEARLEPWPAPDGRSEEASLVHPAGDPLPELDAMELPQVAAHGRRGLV